MAVPVPNIQYITFSVYDVEVGNYIKEEVELESELYLDEDSTIKYFDYEDVIIIQHKDIPKYAIFDKESKNFEVKDLQGNFDADIIFKFKGDYFLGGIGGIYNTSINMVHNIIFPYETTYDEYSKTLSFTNGVSERIELVGLRESSLVFYLTLDDTGYNDERFPPFVDDGNNICDKLPYRKPEGWVNDFFWVEWDFTTHDMEVFFYDVGVYGQYTLNVDTYKKAQYKKRDIWLG